MIGKIMKYEFKSVSRYLIIVHAALLICTALLGFLFNWSDNGAAGVASGFLAFMYFILTIAAAIMTFLIPAVRYYRSMYSDEGYLTHSIPVRTSQLIIGKGLVYLIWMVIDVVCIFAPAFLMIGVSIPTGEMDRVIEEIGQLSTAAGLPLPAMIGYIVLWVLLGQCFSIMMVYFCISVGSRFAGYKGIASVIAYVATTIVIQIISFAGMIGVMEMLPDKYDDYVGQNYIVGAGNENMIAELSPLLHIVMILTLVLFAVTAAVTVFFYWFSWHTADRKLNL